MDKEKKLKKKLFIGGAYLVVALLLLIYVSYSAYRIRYHATVQMPEALQQKASLDITYYSQEEGREEDTDQKVLNGLKPNENVRNYVASDEAKEAALENGRAIKFEVSNKDLIAANEGKTGDIYSKLKTQYTVTLIETGAVPLSCVMVDADGNEYTVSTTDEYERRSKVFRERIGSTNQYKKAVFYLPNDKEETHEYTIYFGWNNSYGATDGSRRGEIATIEIQANIVESVPTGASKASPSDASPSEVYYYTDTEPETTQSAN